MIETIERFRKKYTLAVLLFFAGTGLAFYTAATLTSYTIFAGTLLAVLILVATPVSGTSLNPARTLGSAAVATIWADLWLYLVAPPIGALLATVAYHLSGKRRMIICAKLNHAKDGESCIFENCGYKQRSAITEPVGGE